MPNNNLRVDLNARTDKDGKKFFVGKLRFPGTINCEDGIAFLVFIADDGNEQLQITGFDKKEGNE